MVDVTYPLFSIFAFVGFVVVLIPLPWHLQAWNSGTCYFMMWTALSCLNQFVNSVVWSGNVENHSAAWCEISIRILIASSVGIPAASLCINRRLYQIASPNATRFGHAEKSRAILIDTLICVLLPLLVVALHYIVQGHRFNIFEDIGCYPALYNTLLRYFISNTWPIAIGLTSAVYCFLSLRAFTRRRLEFGRFLNSTTSSLTIGRYFRLMALAMCDILLTTPLAIFTIWLNATVSPVQPWISWEDTHYGYSRIDQIPAAFWRRNQTIVIIFEFTRWMAPLCAFIFFVFFGFADEAKKYYTRLFRMAIRPLNRGNGKGTMAISDVTSTITPRTPGSSYLPTFNTQPQSPREDTIVDIKNFEPVPNPFSNAHDKFQGAKLAPLSPQPSPTETHTNQPISQSTPSPFASRRHSSYF